MTEESAARPAPPLALAIFLIVAGAIGWWAAFSLTVEKFEVLENPGADLACDFSVLVQCGKNLGSWQGAVFGFPNPVLGVTGFVAPIVVGAGLLAGARYARWYWIAFHAGVTAGLAFVIWLIAQSIFSLGTLCPYCMVVWTVTIPTFWAVTAHALAEGAYGRGGVRFGTALRGWVVPITLICYGLVVLLAQVELNALFRL
ncbi:vitamin K epoxide reductase family protein [Nocardioides hungaricus]